MHIAPCILCPAIDTVQTVNERFTAFGNRKGGSSLWFVGRKTQLLASVATVSKNFQDTFSLSISIGKGF